MNEPPPPPERRPGRPRSAQADAAILEAALDLFLAVGYAGMSMEAVAERAGVGKTTIYRRYPSKQALMIALASRMHLQLDPWPSGNLREVTTYLLKELLRMGASPRTFPFFLRVMSEFPNNPALFSTLQRELIAPRLERLTRAVREAIERGEIRADVDEFTVLNMIAGSVVFRVLAQQIMPPPPPDFVERVLNLLWEGLTPRDQEIV